MDQLSHIQNDVILVFDRPKRRRFILHLKIIIINNETMLFYLLQRRNDVVSPRFKCQKEELVPRFHFFWGGGWFGFRSYLLANARWSEQQQQPTIEVLERRLSGGPADGESTIDLSEP